MLKIIDWLGTQGAGNLRIYMIPAITGGAFIAAWPE